MKLLLSAGQLRIKMLDGEWIVIRTAPDVVMQPFSDWFNVRDVNGKCWSFNSRQISRIENGEPEGQSQHEMPLDKLFSILLRDGRININDVRRMRDEIEAVTPAPPRATEAPGEAYRK